ncbi:MAG: signal transduction protein [Candidatus Lambdaproteobacteria bacterium RIFOXYD1_FULL_56_27]|uniref:Signal transduction protein n=1 Tax=Candidatus Lambdaproteobacteria bacterium RIFOXYD2_FULL_56_26 TaxID=1817773 RepID=A0A1F6H413_9PROT|nr:MAG: signal transduction protein [Candidatus Lambdaproteobacteria bacterium RIFOXYC1_FULL_56_13]OGH05105.1 MAG: signal transduction protein [Candidatus Lambdaproteobacteria bacterium RIFOXYD2_FULL_56_26]OGH09569.1 MAG: signal transduction protein [Candidatus Lambdaproteobacteria bacterium RIFOXYD1_FULL_56_27]
MDQLKKIRNTPVSELMAKDVVSIDGSKMVSEALALMKKNGVTAIVVNPRNEEDTYGIVTEADILKKVVDPGEETYTDLWNTPVYYIMTKPCIMVNPGMRVKYALRMMGRQKIRRLLVVDGNRLVGLLDEGHVLAAVQALPVNKDVAL